MKAWKTWAPKSALFIRPLVAAALVWLAGGGGTLGPAAGESPQGSIQWPTIALPEVISGLDHPVYVTHARDGSGRIFIVEQLTGKIRIFKNGQLLSQDFLSIGSRISTGSERGLLSVAFPPDFANKKHFYVYYTNGNGDVQVSRFQVSANDPDDADENSEQIVLTIPHPFQGNHNGGQLQFGPNDGYLYMGTGDGGGSGDPYENAQDPGELLGKILRLDVETGNPVTYTIPATNPYTQTGGYKGEIWALGVRNPWRFSFDRQTKDLYIGDVGQNTWEEVDFQPASSSGGENYGWDNLEGEHCYEPSSGCVTPSGYVAPKAEYNHSLGCSVTGGYVYRGIVYPRMQGVYFYGDYCSGRIWGLQYDGAAWQSTQITDTHKMYSFTSFGEDEVGNLYVTDYDEGKVFLITDPSVCCDFNESGRVDIQDVMRVAAAWDTDTLQYDFNIDGAVNLLDLTLVASHWNQVIP
ncbi:MAG: PQQ-dependent sugar dehydrogenase [Chloroflexi bacterium]|nr:PQQ-dependent sugar dehydrogenase [Chloroflexota bacterium]